MPIIRLQNGNGETNVHYEFDSGQKPIGEGGMGRVFRGIQVDEGSNGLRKERDVAIKCLLEDLPEHAIKRSRREASIRLKNDNLVEMIDFVETHESYVIHYHVVSELLNGVNLDELLDGRTTNHDGNPNPTAERLLHNYSENRKTFAGEVFRCILSGIMALHDAGYIHRDIDPSNIMVTTEGKIKLIDFGIAKKVNELFTTGKSLTSPGQFIGKPYYAAPELLLGDLKQQSYTTDVYALGIVLFQLMTGHLPFEGTFQEVYEKQMHEKLPLGEVEDKTVRKIIEKATEKDQRKRYQSAAEFRVDLDRWISEAPKTAKSYKPSRPPKPSRSNSGSKPIGKWIGIAAAGLVIVGLVAYIATRPPKPVVEVVPQEVTVEEPEPVVVVEEVRETEPVSMDRAKELLKDKNTAKTGFDMLQQLVEENNDDAIFLMSRLYFDPTFIDKGNEFYQKEWKDMRENCGLDANNTKAHGLLMDAFGKNESDIAMLYELGCDFLYARGTEKCWEKARWCFEEINDKTKEGDPYKDAITKKLDATSSKTKHKP